MTSWMPNLHCENFSVLIRCVYFRYLPCKRNSSKQIIGTFVVMRLVVRNVNEDIHCRTNMCRQKVTCFYNLREGCAPISFYYINFRKIILSVWVDSFRLSWTGKFEFLVINLNVSILQFSSMKMQHLAVFLRVAFVFFVFDE